MQFRGQRVKPEEPAAIASACRFLVPGIPTRRGLHCHLDGIRQPPVHYAGPDPAKTIAQAIHNGIA